MHCYNQCRISASYLFLLLVLSDGTKIVGQYFCYQEILFLILNNTILHTNNLLFHFFCFVCLFAILCIEWNHFQHYD